MAALPTVTGLFGWQLAQRLERAHVLRASGRVWLGRALLLLIGGVARYLAIVAPDSIASLVAYAWGGMGAAFGPVIILALYWRRFNFAGALASIVAVPAAVAVTLLTPPPSDEVTAQFDRVNAAPQPA